MGKCRSIFAILILFLLIVLPWLGGCRDDEPTSPGNPSSESCGYFDTQDFSWGIYVYDPDEQNSRGIEVIYNGYVDPLNPPEVSLRIAGAAVPLTFSGVGNWWIAEASLDAGSSYSFELTASGQTTKGNLSIAFTPHAVFPETIVAGQSARVTWTLDGPASCQLAGACSGDMQDDEDCYDKTLNSSAREFTFPAGCVPGWGDQETYLSLAIFNRDVVMVGKTLILISSGLVTRDYRYN
jgi:hypothetical protein